MHKFTHLSLVIMVVLVLLGCRPVGTPTATAVLPVLKLTVQTQNGTSTFQQVGEVINYSYVVTNTATPPLVGPVIVVDAPRQVACPELTTIGNQDAYLDLNETITCIGSYTVTQADVDAGSITNIATANAGGVVSNQSGVTLTRSQDGPSGGLTLVKTANTLTYTQVGQAIIYTYAITNMGSSQVGPTQFTISDNKLGEPFNCGPSDITLIPLESLTCSASYTITQADLSLATLTNSATASGGGQTSAPGSITISNGNAPTPTATLAIVGTLVPATPFSGTPNPTAGTAMRITFDPGQTTAARIGIINPNETISYVLNIDQGKVLSITLTAAANDVALGLDDPMGVVIKPLDATPVFITLTLTAGDYFIHLVSLSASSTSYTLEVELSAPAVPTSATSQP